MRPEIVKTHSPKGATVDVVDGLRLPSCCHLFINAICPAVSIRRMEQKTLAMME